MDKEQTLHQFWSSFGVEAYDENSVPDDAGLPRITYSVTVDGFGETVALTASVWARSTSWKGITEISHRIAQRLSDGGQTIPYDGGLMWVRKGTPFMQRMADSDDSIRRIYINIEVEYISEV